MGETTVGHVAGEVVRALYGAGYMESTIGQYRKSIRALERYAGGSMTTAKPGTTGSASLLLRHLPRSTEPDRRYESHKRASLP